MRPHPVQVQRGPVGPLSVLVLQGPQVTDFALGTPTISALDLNLDSLG